MSRLVSPASSENAVLNIEADMQRGRDGGMDIPGLCWPSEMHRGPD